MVRKMQAFIFILCFYLHNYKFNFYMNDYKIDTVKPF